MRCTSNFASGEPDLTQDQHQVFAWMGRYANAEGKTACFTCTYVDSKLRKKMQAPCYHSIEVGRYLLPWLAD